MTHTAPPGAKGPKGRGRRLIDPLRVTTAVALLLALGGTVLSGAPARRAAEVLVGILVGVPIVRVVFLIGRWWQIGDRRFAAVATALLGVIATGAAIALVTA